MRSRVLCSAQTTVFPRKMLVFRLEALYAAADLVFIAPSRIQFSVGYNRFHRKMKDGTKLVTGTC
jgi:hypothetical protein